MRHSLPARIARFLVCAAVIAGCGKSSESTGPASGTVNQSTADDLAIQTVASLDLVGGDVQAAVGGTPSAPTRAIPAPTPGAMSRPARALWDTTFTQNGITYEASRTFYDALDNPLSDYGPLATWMRWIARAYGTYEGPRDTATVGHAANLDLHGLEVVQDTLRLDGGCADTLQNRFRSLDGTRNRFFYWTSGATIANVRFLKSLLQAGGGAPISGTVTFVVAADRLRSNNRADVEAHFEAIIVVTFNGAGPAVITVNGRYYYQWDLSTGQVARV